MDISQPPSNRIQQKQQSQILSHQTNNPQLRAALKVLQGLLHSSYGPHGKLKSMQNNVGGHVTVTSTSGRLFPLLSVSNPVIKLITSATSGHLQLYSDGGLFTALLCTEIVNASFDVDVHRRLLTELNEYFLELCLDYLQDDSATCVLKVDFAKLDVLLDITRSVFQSKAGCFLFSKSLHHLCQLVVQLFLQTLSVNGNPLSIHYMCIEGSNPLSSQLLPGVLFQQLSKQDLTHVQRFTLPTGETCIRSVLFNVSLSGDSEEFVDATYELHNTEVCVDDVVVDKLVQLCRVLVHTGVGLVMCQKVIHPRVKAFLQTSGVIAVDRLGRQYTESLKKLTGGRYLSSIISQPSPEDYGQVTSLDYITIGHKCFIHLENSSSQAHTVVVCNRHEESLAEMKMAFKSALHNLQLLLTRPAVLYGGGCWEMHLASFIRSQVEKEVDQITEDYECSRHQLLTATNIFAHSLERVAMATSPHHGNVHQADKLNHHHWTEAGVTCGCGHLARNDDLVFEDVSLNGGAGDGAGCDEKMAGSKRGLVLDSLPVRLNALQVAVGTANLVLGIRNVIVSKD